MKKHKIQNINNTGFKVPKDYFENLEETVLGKLKSKELPKDAGFKTPDTYFDTLEDLILTKINHNNNSKVVTIFRKRNLIYVSSIAAVILILLNLSLFNSTPSWDDIDVNTVENYIINENISSYELASLLIEKHYNYDIIELEFAEEAIEDYILENVSIEDLIKN